MKLNIAILSAAFVATLSQLANPANAASLINENFGTGNPDQFNVTGTVGSTFTVTNGNIDLIGDGGGFNLYPGKGNYIDLNGSTTGTISSNSLFNFDNGGTLSFDYGKNGLDVSANIFIGNTLIGSVANPTGSLFTNQSFTINSGATGALSFVSTNVGFGGVVLDNIQLTSIDRAATAVPEPLTIIGSLVGGGIALKMKKKLATNNGN